MCMEIIRERPEDGQKDYTNREMAYRGIEWYNTLCVVRKGVLGSAMKNRVDYIDNLRWITVALLILISLLACPVIRGMETLRERAGEKGIRIVGILLVILAVAAFDIRFFGKQVILYFCVYLLGYFFFSDRDYTARLLKGKWFFVILFLITATLNVVLFIYVQDYEGLNTFCNYAAFFFGIPALVCLGHDHLDFSTSVTKFNAKISYVFYIVHFPVVVLCQYFLSLTGTGSIMNYILTIVITYPLVYGLCYVITKVKLIRVLFGMK